MRPAIADYLTHAQCTYINSYRVSFLQGLSHCEDSGSKREGEPYLPRRSKDVGI